MTTLLSTALTAAKAAGDEIMRLYETVTFETKTDGSPVTAADKNAHDILMEHLSKTDVSILSEESHEKMTAPYPERMWVVDPLDGTKDFIAKSGDFSVMIGLLERGVPTLGVVYAPVYDTLYFAERGNGAYLKTNGGLTKLAVSDRTNELRCLRSRTHFTTRMERAAKKISTTLIPRGSVGIRAGLIAEAKGDCFFSWGRFAIWDVCAPHIITTEAGGRVTDTHGAELAYDAKDHRLAHGIVFSNGSSHAHILEALRSTEA